MGCLHYTQNNIIIIFHLFHLLFLRRSQTLYNMREEVERHNACKFASGKTATLQILHLIWQGGVLRARACVFYQQRLAAKLTKPADAAQRSTQHLDLRQVSEVNQEAKVP